MPKNCCAVGCHNVYTKGCGLQFYRFPVDPDRRRQWVAAVDRKDWEPTEYTWLCSAHFVTGTKSNNPLAPNYVPSIFRHLPSPVKRTLEGKVSDYQRRQVAKRRRTEEASRQELAKKIRDKELKDEEERRNKLREEEEYKHLKELEREKRVAEIEEMKSEELKRAKELEEQQASDNVKELVELKAANKKLIEDNEKLSSRCCNLEQHVAEANKEKSKLEIQLQMLSQQLLNEATLKGDDKKVKYFTGLPSFLVLRAIYNLAVKGLPESVDHSMFDQYLLTLVKLRLNAGDMDIAFRFGISQASVSRYFHKWVDILYTRLSFLVHWPERPDLMKTMPNDFRKHFQKCVLIIDCFEVFIERPASLLARAQTYSNYKKHNTVKFLIGVTPQGSVAYISKGWGGRVSDVHLTENCGLLQKLSPGDMILADRGFTIQDSAGMYCAEVCIPPFTKGKKQLSKVEIETARQLSHVRIHVERVIGVIRQKFSILHSTLPVNIVTSSDDNNVSFVDKIVTVCCALCNWCDSVVPFD